VWKVSICDAVNCILWVGRVDVLELDLVQVDVDVRNVRSRWNNMGVGVDRANWGRRDDDSRQRPGAAYLALVC
jgi:hypothetical protein